jgi:hypothetical protein
MTKTQKRRSAEDHASTAYSKVGLPTAEYDVIYFTSKCKRILRLAEARSLSSNGTEFLGTGGAANGGYTDAVGLRRDNRLSPGESGLLARARPGFSVGVVVVHTREATTCIIDGRANDKTEDGAYMPSIAAGDYTVFATIICGVQVHKITRNFKVGPHNI